MNLADIVIIAILILLVALSIRSLKKGNASCSQDCSHCATGCSKVDWKQVRKDIEQDKKNRN